MPAKLQLDVLRDPAAARHGKQLLKNPNFLERFHNHRKFFCPPRFILPALFVPVQNYCSTSVFGCTRNAPYYNTTLVICFRDIRKTWPPACLCAIQDSIVAFFYMARVPHTQACSLSDALVSLVSSRDLTPSHYASQAIAIRYFLGQPNHRANIFDSPCIMRICVIAPSEDNSHHHRGKSVDFVTDAVEIFKSAYFGKLGEMCFQFLLVGNHGSIPAYT
nr:CNT_HP1_G0053050.mRNA.1.CDS.1 [Saccharomyces cerevisiae]